MSHRSHRYQNQKANHHQSCDGSTAGRRTEIQAIHSPNTRRCDDLGATRSESRDWVINVAQVRAEDSDLVEALATACDLLPAEQGQTATQAIFARAYGDHERAQLLFTLAAHSDNERRLTLQREALLMAAESRDVEAVFLSAPNALDIAPLVDAIVAMARAQPRFTDRSSWLPRSGTPRVRRGRSHCYGLVAVSHQQIFNVNSST